MMNTMMVVADTMTELMMMPMTMTLRAVTVMRRYPWWYRPWHVCNTTAAALVRCGFTQPRRQRGCNMHV